MALTFALIYVRRMRWITENMDFVCAGIQEERNGVVGVMTIHEEKTPAARRFVSGVFVKQFDPLNTYVLVCISVTLVANPFITFGLTCFHATWKFSPLKMTAGGILVPSAQIVSMTVTSSLPPLRCWC